MNVAIVGCGAIAHRWVRVLAADQRVTITALVDPAPANVLRLRTTHHLTGQPARSTVEESMARDDVDVVVNLTPPDAHYAVSRAALSAGRHVLSEKPLAVDLGDAVELVRLADAAGVVLAVMRNRGADQGFASFAATAAGHGPLAVTAEVLVELRDPGFRTGQTLPATSDLAVHALDQVQVLISAAPQQVHCVEVAMPFLGGHCALASIVVTFADGSIFAYRGGFAGPGLATSANGLWRVDGAGMSASWDGGASPSGRRVDGAAVAAVPSYQACITAMLDAVQTGAALTSPTVTLRSIAMLDAALTSAATGRRVTVASVPGGQP